MKKTGRFITVASFEQPIQAELVRSKFESENIPAYIVDGNLIGMQPFYSLALGGVKIQVDESDVSRATAIIGEAESSIDTENKCTKCGANSLKKIQRGRFLMIFLSFLLLGLPLLFKKKEWLCQTCGEKSK